MFTLRTLAATLAILSLSGCVESTPQTDSEVRAGIDSIANWQNIGVATWRFNVDHVEAGPGEDHGFLVSNVPFKDFRLTVEFWIEDHTNSGIFIRCKRPVEVPDLNPDDCYEVNIWDNHPNQDFRTGSIVKHVTPESHVDSIGHWNTYDIDVVGASITVKLNGQQTASLNDNSLSSGFIALQYAGTGLLRIRNLKIQTK